MPKPASVPMSLAHTWGTTPEERRLPFPCDRLLPHPHASLYRGVTVQAGPSVVFRWLCQLRAAPYSYDWIDNVGRQSPPTLTPGLDHLAVGQPVMTGSWPTSGPAVTSRSDSTPRPAVASSATSPSAT